MSEFFLELFSEEIPAGLQKSLREKILHDFKSFFDKNSIKSRKSFSLSCPNRVVVVFEGLDKLIKIKSEEIRGPNIASPKEALEGFIRSNNINRVDLFKKKTEKCVRDPNGPRVMCAGCGGERRGQDAAGGRAR